MEKEVRIPILGVIEESEDMLQDLLSSGNSIMMLTKDADGTLTYCYDCKSEEDFNDLISMEVK